MSLSCQGFSHLTKLGLGWLLLEDLAGLEKRNGCVAHADRNRHFHQTVGTGDTSWRRVGFATGSILKL